MQSMTFKKNLKVCKQGLDMVAEGALSVSQNLGSSKVHSTFTAYVEGKIVSEVDNNFFVSRVGIGAYESRLLSTFPRANREGDVAQPSQESLRTQISRFIPV